MRVQRMLQGRWSAICISFAVLVVLFEARTAPAAEPRGFVDRVYKDEAGEHKYVVFVPESYTADKKWPVILYLHGAGERGNDGRLQTTIGLGPSVAAREKTFPFLVVFPQCEDTKGRILTAWGPESPDGKRALAILDAVEQEYRVDPAHRILTGWSMGGYGTWSLAGAHPERFSAIAPLSGGGEADSAKKMAKLPIWAFHGAKDDVVPVEETRKMLAAVKAAGGEPRYTELPADAHEIWKTVYETDALFQWMLDPKSAAPAATEGLVVRPGARPSTGPEKNAPFVPAVEMPRAVYVRLGNEMLNAVAHSVPSVVPKDVLQGRINDIYDSTSVEGRSFSVSLTNISYNGKVERAYVKAYHKDLLNIQLGLRNVYLQIGASYVQGSGRSASAGPMSVVIGHRAPVWLSLVVTPYVANRELKLKLVATKFSIPDDNWYVTGPAGVSVSGLGMTRERVSSGLVNGIYGKKYRIENEVVAVVPSLMSRLEEQLKVGQVDALVSGFWPLPVYKPQVRAWPEAVETDEQGISLVMGVTAGAIDSKRAPRSPKVVEPLGPPISQLPQDTNLDVGVAPNLLGPLTDLLVQADVARIHVLDIPNKAFASFADPKVLAAAIPDLKRFGENVEVWSELVLVEPLSVVDAPGQAGAATAAATSSSVNPAVESVPHAVAGQPAGSGKQLTETPAEAKEPLEKKDVANENANKKDATKKEESAKEQPPADKQPAEQPAAEPEPAQPPAPHVLFRAPKVVISLAVRTDPKAEWKPYAEFSFDVSQPASASVISPNFDERNLRLSWSGEPTIVATGRFAPGYQPETPEWNVDAIRGMFKDSWGRWTQHGPAAETTVADIDFGYSKLRLESAAWKSPYLSVTFGEPGVKLSNDSDAPLEFETKGPYSGWGGPYTLKPGDSSTFEIDYPLLFRRKIDGRYEMFTLPVGSHSEFRPPTGGGAAQLFKARRKPSSAVSSGKGA